MQNVSLSSALYEQKQKTKIYFIAIFPHNFLMWINKDRKKTDRKRERKGDFWAFAFLDGNAVICMWIETRTLKCGQGQATKLTVIQLNQNDFK